MELRCVCSGRSLLWRLSTTSLLLPSWGLAETPASAQCLPAWDTSTVASWIQDAPEQISFEPALVSGSLAAARDQFTWTREPISAQHLASWFYLRGMAAWWTLRYRDGKVAPAQEAEVLPMFQAAAGIDPSFSGLPEFTGADAALWRRASAVPRPMVPIRIPIDSAQWEIFIDGRPPEAGVSTISLTAGPHLVQVQIRTLGGDTLGYAGVWLEVEATMEGQLLMLPDRAKVPCTGEVSPYDTPVEALVDASPRVEAAAPPALPSSASEPFAPDAVEPERRLTFHPALSVWYLPQAFVLPEVSAGLALRGLELRGGVGAAMGSAVAGENLDLLLPAHLGFLAPLGDGGVSVGAHYRGWIGPGGVIHSALLSGEKALALTDERDLTLTAYLGVAHWPGFDIQEGWSPAVALAVGVDL